MFLYTVGYTSDEVTGLQNTLISQQVVSALINVDVIHLSIKSQMIMKNSQSPTYESLIHLFPIIVGFMRQIG